MYLISAEMLGPGATGSDAKKMVELLTERGYAVAFGEPVDNDTDYINDDAWMACLNRISEEKESEMLFYCRLLHNGIQKEAFYRQGESEESVRDGLELFDYGSGTWIIRQATDYDTN